MAGIADRVKEVEERIAEAARRSKREPQEITLIAASKAAPLNAVLEAINVGIRHIGENRVQEALQKYASIRGQLVKSHGIHWHFIGHLQSNKAKKVISFFDLVQSVDSLELATALSRHAEAEGKIQRCLIQVNFAGEATKFGCAPEQAEQFLNQASQWPSLRWQGLMGIAPWAEDPESLRPFFRGFRAFFEKWRPRFLEPPILSLGMSHDYQVAIEEGSTMVRMGTALFGPRP